MNRDEKDINETNSRKTCVASQQYRHIRFGAVVSYYTNIEGYPGPYTLVSGSHTAAWPARSRQDPGGGLDERQPPTSTLPCRGRPD